MNRRGKAWPTKRGWKPAVKARSPRKVERQAPLTAGEFVAWVLELSDEAKWRARPTAWDDHVFRVSVQREVKRVAAPSTENESQPTPP